MLLAALVATTALSEGHGIVGFTRAQSGCWSVECSAWRKAPFLLVLLAAAGAAGVLRLLGVRRCQLDCGDPRWR